MQKTISALLIVVGVIHLLPIVGVLSSGRLFSLYAVFIEEPNLEILMRHRAVLFGLLGSFLIYAAFKPELQLMAIIAGFISVLSFIFLAWSVGGYNDAIGRVVIADLVATALLFIAAVLCFWNRSNI